MNQAATISGADSTGYSIVRTWWPLGVVGVLMSLDVPLVSAAMARLAAPEINLAAFGGVVYPLVLLLEAPVLMLLVAATAICKDWPSYLLVRRFALWSGASLAGIHALLALTPLYDTVVAQLMGAPQEILKPAKLGLAILIPQAAIIAYRYLQQGVLIRHGHSVAVGLGTLLRVVVIGLVLALGMTVTDVPGIVVAAAALLVGEVAEVVWVSLYARSVVHKQLVGAPAVEPPTLSWFLRFYAPLALSPLLLFLALPIASAGISRMAFPLGSLAVWPVIGGLLAVFRNLGLSFHEVVVTLLDKPVAARDLRRFAFILAALSSACLLAIAATPAASFWFEQVGALAPHLAGLGQRALWLVLLLPALFFLQSWYQGVLIYNHQTRAVIESIALFLLVSSAVVGFGVVLGRITGLYVGLFGIVAGSLAQVVWLQLQSRRQRSRGPCTPE